MTLTSDAGCGSAGRGKVPGDATLQQAAVLRFAYAVPEQATPAVAPGDTMPKE